MFKALTILRTFFLLFIVGYTLLSAPAEVWGSAAVAVRMESLQRVHRAAWLAIAWIALEVLVSWMVLWARRRRPEARPSAPPAAKPPTASPPAAPAVRG